MNDLKTAIREANSAIILLPDHVTDKDYLAALQLQRISPDKIHIVAPEHKENNWSDTFDIKPVKKEFAITINTEISPIDELRYEKNDNALTIFLTHKHAFNKNSLSFAEHLPPADLIITMGFSSQKEAEQVLESLPHRGTARHIWLEDKTGGRAKLTTESVNLMGRLMVRSRLDPDLQVMWSFITKDDFAKADATPTDLPKLIATLNEVATLPRAAIIFWQYGDKGTNGVIWSDNTKMIDSLSQKFEAERLNGSVMRLPMFDNFIEAETEVRKLMHGTLSE
jgi:hypothetical protein